MEEALEKLENANEKIPSSPALSKPSPSDEERIARLLKAIPNSLSAFGVPPRFIRPDLAVPESLAGVLGPNGEVERSLCLLGGPGVGKTMAVCLLIQESLRRRAKTFPGPNWWPCPLPWKFIVYPEFIMKVQDSFKNDRGEATAYEMLEKVAKTPLLVIDDLGAEKPTEYVRQATYYIINHREMNLLPTFITTNFSMDHLDDNIDPRISSRICGMCDVVRMDGKDRRIKERRTV